MYIYFMIAIPGIYALLLIYLNSLYRPLYKLLCEIKRELMYIRHGNND